MATEKVSEPQKLSIEGPQLRIETGRTLIAKVKVNIDKNKTHYIASVNVTWTYTNKDRQTFSGENQTADCVNKSAEVRYTPPDNAVSVKCQVSITSATYEKEVAKKNADGTKVTKNGKTVTVKKKTNYLNVNNAAWKPYMTYSYNVTTADTSAPDAPDVSESAGTELKYRITADTTDFYAVNQIQFEVLKDNTETVWSQTCELVSTSSTPGSNNKTAAGSFTMSPGHKYKVRGRKTANGLYWPGITQWSNYSSEVGSGPGGLSLLVCSAYGSDRVNLSWSESAGADDGYEIQYTDTKDLFDIGGSGISSETVPAGTTQYLIGPLDNTEGKTWWFRVRGKGEGDGPWSNVKNCKLATVPSAPSTWQYASAVKQGEPMTVNWTHNSEDNSKQTAAQVGYKIGSAAEATHDETTATLWNIATAGITDGTTVKWRVRTKGAHDNWGEWSDYKEFNVVAAPGVEVSGGIPSSITTFPINMTIVATPPTQSVLSFAITVTADNEYSTLDETGMGVTIPAGGIIYQGFFDNLATNTLEFTLTPGDIQLDSGESYTMAITAHMNSGLSGSVSGGFIAQFEHADFIPNANITFDYDSLTAYIAPTCYRSIPNPDYDPDHEEREEPSVIFAEYTDVYFDIYRREYDGSFTEISTNIDGEQQLTISDPHPSLSIPRYRIVARKKGTGQMFYQDAICDEIGYQAVVIQWDEEWQEYSGNGYTSENDVAITGSRLELQYNIDIQADSKPDVALIEYIGRRAPVSYYGTQKGETGTWKIEIPTSDTNTLYAIRRLSYWDGDAYIREPSGIGYWAHVEVSYSVTHNKLSIPVTFKITRVDGGA